MTQTQPQEQGPLGQQPLIGDPLVGNKLDQLPGLDLQSMDQKIQRMHTVDQTWDLPPIPDNVKMDLAMQSGTDHQSISDFLYGVWHDVSQAVAPINPLSAMPAAAAPTQLPIPGQAAPAGQQPALNVPFDSNPDSAENRIRSYWAGWAGLKAPSVVDPNSVQAIKEQAIQRGLLPDPGPNGTVDQGWSPDMRSIQAQMINQDFASRVGGARPGALSTNQLAGAIDKWLTPSGLLSAAMKFDILPNPKNIVHETQTWGDKWRTFVGHPSAGHLVDALTGPIDDVVVPVVNDFLLLSGVSEAVMFARGAEAAAEGADAARGLYGAARAFRNDTMIGRLGGLGREYDAAAESAKFAEPSFLSKVVGHVPGMGPVEDGMQAWRDWSGTQLAKKAVQTGMKLGVASNLEHLILPSEHGTSIGDLGHLTTFDQYVKSVSTNPLTHGLQQFMNVAFAPPTVYGEGAVSHLVGSFTDATKAKLLGVTDNQRLTGTIAQLLHSKLAEEAATSDDPAVRDQFARVSAAYQKQGPSAALEEYYGTKEHAGAITGYLTAVAAASADGAAKAGDYLGGPAAKYADPAKWRQWSQFFRNKAVAQLSNIDEEDMPMYASARAFGEASSPKQRLTLVKKYLDQTAADAGKTEAQSWIQNHQALRSGYWNQLLTGVNEDSLRTVLDEAWPTIGNWDKFTNANYELTQARATGVLGADTRLMPAKSQIGRNLVENEVTLESSGAPRNIGSYPRSPDLNLDLQLAPPRNDSYTQRWVNPLAAPIDPGTARFTVAAAGTPTKQDALSLAHYSDWLLKRRDQIEAFQGKAGGRLLGNFVQPLQQKAADLGQAFHEVDRNVVNSWIDDLAAPNGLSKNRAKQLSGLVRWASENGFDDMNGMKAALDQDIAAVSGAPIWSDQFGIGRNLTVDAGKSLLHSQVRELRKSANWMAAEVDTGTNPDLKALGNRLGNQGYKLVHGVQFITPQDVAELPGSFEDVNSSTLHRLTIGSFIDRQEPTTMRALRDRSIRSELAGQLTQASAAGHLLTPSGEAITQTFKPDSPELEQVVDQLKSKLLQMKTTREADVAEAYATRGLSGRLLARASNRGLPYDITDMTQAHVSSALDNLYGKNAAPYVHQALLDARRAGGFKLNGLVQIENNLRAHDNVNGILKVLGRTSIGQAIDEYQRAETGAKKLAAVAHGAGQLFTPSAIAGGTIGAGLAGANTHDNPQAMVAGGLAGALGAPIIKAKAFSWLADRESAALAAHPTWQRYTHLADGLSHLRDELRFHLNPFFDLRRYTNGYALSLMHDMPVDRSEIPLNMSMRSFVRKYGNEAAGTMRGAFRDIATHQYGGFNPDIIDDVSKAWAQQGLLGYNPTEHMVGMFGHLVKAGADPEQAYQTAKDVYQYGTTGRSGLEQSANFLFFPFSFEKKVMTTAGKFLTSDLSRAQMLHDSLQAYQILDQRYDLTNYWQQHLPVLNEMQKLNVFAHGLSPGELGGINRPLLNAAAAALGKGASEMPILNAFIPQGVNITGTSDGEAMTSLAKRIMPVYNDMSRMLDDVAQQGHVLFSPAHMTSEAETQHGWAEANTLKDQVDQAAIQLGHRQGIRAVMAATPGSSLYGMKQAYEQKRLEISQKFPAWNASIVSATSRRLMNENELNQRMTGIEQRIQQGQNPKPGDMALATFFDADKAFRSQLTSRGVSIDDHPELVAGSQYQAVREAAIQLAEQDPAFLTEYKRYFERTYGPIQRTI